MKRFTIIMILALSFSGFFNLTFAAEKPAEKAFKFKLHCPHPKQILQVTIPSSINAEYRAQRDGIEYTGLSPVLFDNLKFYAMGIDHTHGYWSIVCQYQQRDNNNSLVLVSKTNPLFSHCKFKKLPTAKVCQGRINQCVMLCAQ